MFVYKRYYGLNSCKTLLQFKIVPDLIIYYRLLLYKKNISAICEEHLLKNSMKDTLHIIIRYHI